MKTLIIELGGRCLWAKNGGGGDLLFSSSGGTTWEMFNITSVGEKVKIQTYDGHYLWAENGGGGYVGAVSGGGNTWETFAMIDAGDGKTAFKTYDGQHYLSVSWMSINAKATSIGANEKFTIEKENLNPEPKTEPIDDDCVTVGHTGSKANYICDGTADEVEIALAMGELKTVKLINDRPYILSGPIISPDGGKLTAFDINDLPTIQRTSKATMFVSNPGQAFDLGYIKFDGSGFGGQPGITFAACKQSYIRHCEMYNFNMICILSLDARPGDAIDGNNIISIKYNHIHDNTGVQIFVTGKTDPDGNGKYCEIAYNHIHDNMPPVGTVLAAIFATHADVHHNTIYGIGAKTDDINTANGIGINPARCRVDSNVIRGCGGAGIVPTSRRMASRIKPVEVECQDDCYCKVSNNICQFNGHNGIDFWYSDGCTVEDNICTDNGQRNDSCYCDRAGIDVSNHSQGTTVNRNICENRAAGIMDAVSISAMGGSPYVVVNDITKWYDSQNGYICPFVGLTINIGGSLNRIDRVDIANKRLYLVGGLKGGNKSASTAIAGENMQVIGINIADNEQTNDFGPAYIGHHGVGNKVPATGHPNLTAQIGVVDKSLKALPKTQIT